MKIRSSFVSNSSSASYIITINKEKSEFVMECLREYAHSYFYEKDFAALIEKRISAALQEQEYAKESADDEYKGWKIQEATTTLAAYRDYKSRLEACDHDLTRVFDLLMEHKGIEVEEVFDKTLIKGKTDMHNSMDDMPDFMKDVALYYLANAPEAIRLRVESHS